MNSFPRLFEPMRIGSMTVPNRICFAASSSELADLDGHAGPRMAAYYAERARGGAGLIVVEATYVEMEGRRLPRNAMLHEDGYIPGLRLIADAVHEAGGKIALQLNHGGREAVTAVSGSTPLGPSPIASSFTGGGTVSIPRELTRAEILRIVGRFADAAQRAREAGYDAVELHGAHGYLISQFLSPDANRREDQYGRDVRGRSRFAVEIVAEIKRRMDDYPVIFRMNSSDHAPGGLELDEALQIARFVEEAGADSISLSAGIHASRPYRIIPGMAESEAWNRAAARAMRERVSVPVMTVGRISEPRIAEDLLAAGDADVICLSRALIADPYWPAKARAGRVEEITPCIACNECVANIHNHNGVACTVNPLASRELELRPLLDRRPPPRRVAVIGAGAAGLAAATTAARRGHEVHIFERSDQLGGQLDLARRPPQREKIGDILAFYRREVDRLGLTVHLGREPSPDEVGALRPDVVIVSIGARSVSPDLAGTSRTRVLTGWKVLAGLEKPGPVSLVVGGGLVGVEVADFLAHHGGTPILVARSEILKKAVHADKVHYVDRFAELDMEVLTHTRVLRIGDGWVEIQTRKRLPRRLEGIDDVIFCTGYADRMADGAQFEGLGVPVHHVGDVRGSRKFFEAIREGTLVALEIA